jgi:hypothetical protein
MENAPKDRRIVAYGRHANESGLSWATVAWNAHYKYWQCDPNEASEYDPEPSQCSLWFDLPQDGVIADNGPKQDVSE